MRTILCMLFLLMGNTFAYADTKSELAELKKSSDIAIFRIERENWVNQQVDDLVLEWGKPEDIYERKDGGKYLTYKTTTRTIVDAWSGKKTSSYCYTTFISNPKGIITSWRTKGTCVYHTKD